MEPSLAHLDRKTCGILERAISTLTMGYGSNLIAVVLYGSATGPEFIPRRSDLNLLLLLARVNVAALETARDLAGRWRKDRVVPVLMTGTDLRSSLDVFPIEMLELQVSGIVLVGEDPFAQVSIQRDDLRHQCEHELKRHLFKFRRAYLGLGWGGGERSRLLIASVTGLLPLFRTLSRLIETEPQPRTSRDVLVRIADHTGIDHTPFLTVLDQKRDGRHRSSSEWRTLSDAYLVELERLIDAVDRLDGGFDAHVNWRCFALVVLCAPVLIAATEFPSPRGRVSDFAEVIDPAHAARMTSISEALERRTGIQLAVVTIQSYAPEASLDDYAVGLFKAWGVGKAAEDNGLLLITAVAERRVRIEVGYGLEPIVTDGRAGEIIDREILPSFRLGEYGEGLSRGASALATLVTGAGGAAEPDAEHPIPGEVLIAAFLLGGLLLVALLTSRRRLRRRGWWDTGGTWGSSGGLGGFGGGGFGGFGGGASGGGGAGRGW